MTTLIIISVLPIVILYLGLYKVQKALLPVTVVGLLAALGAAVMQWDNNAEPIYHGMMLFNNFSVAFSVVSIVSTILILLLSKGYFERISKPYCRVLCYNPILVSGYYCNGILP
jgi:NADH-quinone oxidoreductase subunit N